MGEAGLAPVEAIFRDLQIAVEVFPPTTEELTILHEEDIFELIEYFHDKVSSGVNDNQASYHDFCRQTHYTNFSPEMAQSEYRVSINRLLDRSGYEYTMNDSGRIQHRGISELSALIGSAGRKLSGEDLQRYNAAIRLYYQRSENVDSNRSSAVRNLGDILENHRDTVKAEMLDVDDRTLFGILNSFGIRHHKANQKYDYDRPAWHAWLFYVNLASIALVTHLESKE